MPPLDPLSCAYQTAGIRAVDAPWAPNRRALLGCLVEVRWVVGPRNSNRPYLCRHLCRPSETQIQVLSLTATRQFLEIPFSILCLSQKSSPTRGNSVSESKKE